MKWVDRFFVCPALTLPVGTSIDLYTFVDDKILCNFRWEIKNKILRLALRFTLDTVCSYCIITFNNTHLYHICDVWLFLELLIGYVLCISWHGVQGQIMTLKLQLKQFNNTLLADWYRQAFSYANQWVIVFFWDSNLNLECINNYERCTNTIKGLSNYFHERFI